MIAATEVAHAVKGMVQPTTVHKEFSSSPQVQGRGVLELTNQACRVRVVGDTKTLI